MHQPAGIESQRLFKLLGVGVEHSQLFIHKFQEFSGILGMDVHLTGDHIREKVRTDGAGDEAAAVIEDRIGQNLRDLVLRAFPLAVGVRDHFDLKPALVAEQLLVDQVRHVNVSTVFHAFSPPFS